MEIFDNEYSSHCLQQHREQDCPKCLQAHPVGQQCDPPQHSISFHFHGVLLLAPVVLPKYLSNVGVESVTVLPQQIA